MKHLLLSAAAFCIGAVSMYAQDASEWKPGDDISEFLEWGDYDGTTNSDAYWQGTGAAYGFNAWEIFQGVDADRYQVVHLPAGVYKFMVRAFYRDGSPEQAFKNFWAGKLPDRAKFYADVVDVNETEDEEGNLSVSYTVNKSYEKAIVSLWSEGVTTELFAAYNENGDREWFSDAYFAGENGTTYYAPNSMEGAKAYFDKEYFENELKLVLLEEGDVKLGIRRPGEMVGSDWILFSNFRMIYEGDAGEAAELELAMEEFNKWMENANALSSRISGEYGSLGAFMQEELADLEGSASTLEEVVQATEDVKAFITKYEAYYSSAQQLTSMIKFVESLTKSNGYSDDAIQALNAALAVAKKVEQDGNSFDDPILEAPEDYATALTALLEARSTFVLSKGAKEDGTYDATDLIAYPWICNTEYNPTYNPETGFWEHSDVVLNDAGWGAKNDVDGTDKPSGDANIAIASDVVLSKDSTITNAWYLKGEFISGGCGDYVPYWNDGFTCAKTWSTPFVGWYDMRQKLTGIPNGFYRLQAFGGTWTIEWGEDGKPTCMNHIYAKSGDERVVSGYVEPSGWWANDKNEWRELTTPMIQVKDGELLISSRANGFSAFTGFRLTYYGENPDFSAMVTEELNALKEDYTSKLILEGDKKAVEAILAAIPETVSGFDAYSAALSTIAEARAYVDEAYGFMNSWTTIEDYGDLQNSYEQTVGEGEVSEEARILDVPYMAVLAIGEDENDTYLDAKASVPVYNAYAHYLQTRMKMKNNTVVASNEEMKSILATQYAWLVENYADVEKLNEYEVELAKCYNVAVLAGVDMANASEANPVDITVLLTNPSYNEGTEGWTGELVVDNELKNAERYNTNFNVFQTLYALPAGAYQVQVTGFYRDGGLGNTSEGAYFNWWYDAAADIEMWKNKNVELYAISGESERIAYMTSIASEMFTEPSFTTYVTDSVELEEDEFGNLTYEYRYADINMDDPTFPFDGKVDDMGDIYWYPNSMRGSYHAFAKNPNAYKNSVQIMIKEGEDLTLGLRKSVTINGDWCMFDNWKLYYLGQNTPTGIENAVDAVGEPVHVEYYSVNGVRNAAPMRGVNIVKTTYKDGTVKTSKVIRK